MSEYRDLHRDAVPSDSLKVQSTSLLHATASATTGGRLVRRRFGVSHDSHLALEPASGQSLLDDGLHFRRFAPRSGTDQRKGHRWVAAIPGDREGVLD